MYFIFGQGRSGIAAASFLQKKKQDVLVFDEGQGQDQKALQNGFIFKRPSKDTFEKIKTFVLSPGISTKHPLVQEAIQYGLTPISDIQLFFDFFPNVKAIGVTGSNGKSTTCSMIAHLLRKKDIPFFLCGNIGTSVFADVLQEQNQEMPNKIYVLELSSYQLDLSNHLPLHVACILNIFQHHLDRHGSFKNYVCAKLKIFDHAQHALMLEKRASDFMPYLQNNRPITYVDEKKEDHRFSKNDLENASMALAALEKLQIASHLEDLIDFEKLPHRQEPVCTIRSILFINDSKATNPASVVSALENIAALGPCFWIAGGVIEDDDLSILDDHCLKPVEHAFLIGNAAKRYGAYLSSKKPYTLCNHLEEAVQKAFEKAQTFGKGVVLFSPGCSSFDQFKDFVDRGNQFKNLVFALLKNERDHV